MNNARIERMMRELQCDPITELFCSALSLATPAEVFKEVAAKLPAAEPQLAAV